MLQEPGSRKGDRAVAFPASWLLEHDLTSLTPQYILNKRGSHRKELNLVKVFGRVTVFPIMPARISRLYELAYNLWWSWHPEARALYEKLDPSLCAS